MDEIPDDIEKAAEQAQDRAIERCKVAKLAAYEYPFCSGAAKAVLDDEIARALLAEREAATKAERERCKAEAEKVQDRDLLGASSDYSAGHFVACGRILAAIRSGARP